MKAGGALATGYWPAGIPRRVPVPQRPIPALVRRAAATARDRPALVGNGQQLTHRELDAAVQGVAAGLRAFHLGSKAVAVVEEDASEALVLLLGALDAGCQVVLLDHRETGDRLAGWSEAGGAQAVLTGGSPGRAAAQLPLRLVARSELPKARAAPAGLARPEPPKKPAVMLPAGDGLVAHSHFSLAAMGTALTTFIPKLRSLDFVTADPIFEWEALAGVLAALLAGRAAILFAEPWPGEGGAYTILRRDAADAVLQGAPAPAAWAHLRYVFLSVGPFSVRWRQQVEATVGRPVLPLWGSVEVGPAIAAHPSWFPVGAHGLPLVNVTAVAVNPDTGRPSEVPWTMLSRAELGIDSPSAMVAVAGTEGPVETRAATVVRTRRTVEINHVGVVRFIA